MRLSIIIVNISTCWLFVGSCFFLNSLSLLLHMMHSLFFHLHSHDCVLTIRGFNLKKEVNYVRYNLNYNAITDPVILVIIK